MAKIHQSVLSKRLPGAQYLSWKMGNPKSPGMSISSALFSSFQQNSVAGNLSPITYVNYNIYKGRASLSVAPVMPKFATTDSGNIRIEKKGVIMLGFAPAIIGQQLKYDMERKQMFALSATEVGAMIGLGPSESCEFLHDPSMKTSLAGQVRKNFSVAPISDGSGHFFTLSVVNSILKTNERISLPVTKAEFAVLRAAFSFILPHIMGWDKVIRPFQKVVQASQKLRSELAESPNSEWSR